MIESTAALPHCLLAVWSIFIREIILSKGLATACFGHCALDPSSQAKLLVCMQRPKICRYFNPESLFFGYQAFEKALSVELWKSTYLGPSLGSFWLFLVATVGLAIC